MFSKISERLLSWCADVISRLWPVKTGRRSPERYERDRDANFLGINDEEHSTVLNNLRTEEPHLFTPRQQQTLGDATTVLRRANDATEPTVIRRANNATPAAQEEPTMIRRANNGTP